MLNDWTKRSGCFVGARFENGEMVDPGMYYTAEAWDAKCNHDELVKKLDEINAKLDRLLSLQPST